MALTNLELAFAMAEIYDDLEVLIQWINITEDQAAGDTAKSFLPFCAAVCLGNVYTKKRDKKTINILKGLANDSRWRIREAVAFGFQIIGKADFNRLRDIFSEWIKNSNNMEKRAILVSLAHPEILDENRSIFCFEICEVVLKEMDQKVDMDVLRKGLDFTISVFIIANPLLGFDFIKKWLGIDKDIDKIMRSNLKKNRLVKRFPKEVNNLLMIIE